MLSPYFFGASFTLLTDNLAILFALLALERIHAYARDGSLAAFAAGLPLRSRAAVLTRQSFLWLAPVAAFFLLRRGGARRASWPGGALLGARAGAARRAGDRVERPVPPSADPASCGLCTDRPGVGRDALTLRTVGFTVGAARRLRGARARPAGAAPLRAAPRAPGPSAPARRRQALAARSRRRPRGSARR